MTRLVLLGATLLVITALSGCAAPSPTPVPTASSAQAEPSATPSLAPDKPAPLLDLSCDDLSSTETASQYVGTAVEPVDGNAGPGFSRAMALQQIGGLWCGWSDGGGTSNGTYRNLTVTVLPQAEDKWARYAAGYEIVGDEYRYCFARDNYICGYFALVNGAWIESYVEGIRPDAVAEDADAAMIEYVRPMFAGIAGAVTSSQPVDNGWRPGALPLPTSCDAFIEPSDIATISGVDGTMESYTYQDGPQTDQTLGMDGEYLVTTCSWLYTGSDGGIGDMNAVPSGAWAWDPQAESVGSTAMSMTGLRDNEFGYYQCGNSFGCTLDFVIGGNWITLRLYEGGSEHGKPFAANQPEVLVAIGEKIIANLA